MALSPGALVHLQHRPHEHVPGAGQHHHERPDGTQLAGHRVQPAAELPVVDLRLLPGLGRARVPHHHLRPAHLLRDIGGDIAAEAGHAGRQAPLVPQPLVDRRHPHAGLHLRHDVVVVPGDHRPGHLPQPGIGQLREPPPDQPGPLLLVPRRPAARGDARRHRRGDVLPQRLTVHTQAAGHLAQRPARMPVHEYLGHIDHVERSPCHRPPVLDGRKVAPSRWPGPPRHARRPHGNYVIEVGNYVIATPSELGNYMSADNRRQFAVEALRVLVSGAVLASLTTADRAPVKAVCGTCGDHM